MIAEVGGIYTPKNKTVVKGSIIDWFVVEFVYPFGDCIIIGNRGQRVYASGKFIANSNRLNESPLTGQSISERIDIFLDMYQLYLKG